MGTPLISIIIPTYNSERVLDDALASVARQTFRDFEVIVVDGLSKDDTLRIVQKYVDQGLPLIVSSEKDSGIYDAMNKGLQIARGTWLYFLGSDDTFYEENTLEKVLARPEASNYDILYGNVLSSRFSSIYDGEFDLHKLLEKNICHQAIFFKKSVFSVVGAFDTRFVAHADWDHNFRWYFSRSLKHKYIDQVIANYADGGFSSHHNDSTFYLAKSELYYSYARKFMDKKTKLRMLGSIAAFKRNHGMILSGLYYKLRYLLTKYA
jgi:glycosyltransferase involved in cell wall biosynthesis